MKNNYKAILLALFCAAGMTTAKADSQYHLIIGFTQNGNNTGANDVLYDLGFAINVASFTGVHYGETWNVSSLLSAQNLSPSTVQWGVVGDANSTPNGATPEITWTTTSGPAPGTISGDSSFQAIQASVNSLETDFGANGQNSWSTVGESAAVLASLDNSWNEQTINGSGPLQFINAYGVNPNVTGINTQAYLWEVFDNNSSPTNMGAFVLSSSGILTYQKVVTTAPQPHITSVQRSGTTATINFTTTSGHTYYLAFTNSPGLLAPISTWPVAPNSVSGSGGTQSLTDTSSAPNRFYLIKVQ